jgi:hypothetical protein
MYDVDKDQPKARSIMWQRIILLAGILGGFALRLQRLNFQNIWWDEARNIEVALRSFLQIPNAPELDIHPPVYFWLLHLWSRAAGLERSMSPETIAYLTRFLSVAAGIAGVALVFALAKRVAGRQAGIFASVLAASSPFWLAESQETRMYTLGFALLTAAAIFLIDHVLDGKGKAPPLGASSHSGRSRRRLVLFAVLSGLALTTHYNAIFIVAAWYLWWGAWALLRQDRWRQLRTIIWTGLGMTVLVSPVAPIALRQIPGYENPNLTVPGLGQYLRANWVGFLGGYAWDGDVMRGTGIGDWWLWSIFGMGVLGCFLLAWPPRRRSEVQRLAPGAIPDSNPDPPMLNMVALSLLVVWLLGGLAFYYIAVLDRGAFNIRYSSFVTPALYVLVGVGLAGWSRWRRWLPVAGVVLLLLGTTAAARADLTDSQFYREDTAGVAAWLREQAGPDDVIFVDQKYPFGFYYQRYAIDPDVIAVGPEAAPARYLFVDINTIDRQLNQWARDARRVYWVQWFESDTDPREAVSFLLDKYGRHLGEEWFQGYRVNWWQLQPPTEFHLAESMTPVAHRWRNGLESVEISLPEQAMKRGEPVPVVVRWRRTAGDVTRPLKARVALYDQSDARLAQDDRRVLNDRHLMPSEWGPDDHPLNVYLMRPPEDLPAGEYEVRLLVYDAETLEPVELVDEAGNPAGFEPAIGFVRIGE